MTKIPSYKEINDAIKKIADIPSRADDEGAVIADGVILTKNVYDLKNGAYELHVRDKKNNKWKVFDTEDGADCVERAAKCFVDFYNSKHQSNESRKFSCSMQKKKESLAKKSESHDDDAEQMIADLQAIINKYFRGGKEITLKLTDTPAQDYVEVGDHGETDFKVPVGGTSNAYIVRDVINKVIDRYY